MASPGRAPDPVPEHPLLVQEVVGLWVEMQARLQAHFADLAAEQSLSAIQAKVLVNLDPDTAVSMRALASRLLYDPSNLTTVIDRLEQRGAVRRRSDPRDRRVKGLLLTEEGVRLRRTFWERLVFDAGPFGRLEADELKGLRDLLRAAVASTAQA